MRALSHDVPLVIMPMHPMLDQKMIGRSVQEHGAARLLNRTAAPEQIREAVRALLEPGPHHAAAAIGRRLRAHSGAVAGADRLAPVLAQR
jgi:UDP:flavonoid glycosyltransferase YjiC (YdhE family)